MSAIKGLIEWYHNERAHPTISNWCPKQPGARITSVCGGGICVGCRAYAQDIQGHELEDELARRLEKAVEAEIAAQVAAKTSEGSTLLKDAVLATRRETRQKKKVEVA